MTINYYAIEKKAIELKLLTKSDIDDSQTWNCSMNKLMQIIIHFSNEKSTGEGLITFRGEVIKV